MAWDEGLNDAAKSIGNERFSVEGDGLSHVAKRPSIKPDKLVEGTVANWTDHARMHGPIGVNGVSAEG
jgi:hypothetical protein